MMVKIKNSANSWSYFECDVIHSTFKRDKDDLPDDCLKFFNCYPELNQIGSKIITILDLEKCKIPLRKILTDGPVYILNDQGKTIDKI